MTGLTHVRDNRIRQFVGRDDGEWRAVRRTVRNKRAAVSRADHGERSGRGMRATLGTAGKVDGVRTAEILRRDLGYVRRHRTRREMRRGANRRTGTGNDMPAGIVGACDEAKLFGDTKKS